MVANLVDPELKGSQSIAPRRGGFEVLGVVAVGLWLLVALAAGVAVILGHELAGFAFTAGIVTALFWVPLATGRVSLFGIWGAVLLVVTVGTGVRGVVLSLDEDPGVQDFFFRGNPYAALFTSSLIVIVLAVVFVGSYLLGLGRPSGRVEPLTAPFLPSFAQLQTQRALLVIAGVAMTGSLGALLFIRATGGFANTRISDRRATITTINLSDQDSFQSFGHWELLGSLSFLAFLLYLARGLYGGEKLRLTQKAVLTVLALNSLVIPLYSTERAELIAIGLAGTTLLYLTGRQIRVRYLLVVAIFVALAATSLTSVRSGGSYFDPFANPGSLGDEVVDTAVYNRNWADLGKALLIIDSAGTDTLPYANGSTISSYSFSLIPRAVWATKPLVAPGPLIGRAIYGNRVAGVPPGLFGEMVWNFGVFVGGIGVALAGLGLGKLDNFVQRASIRNPGGAVFLVGAAMTAGRDLVSVSLGRALLTLLIGAVTLCAVRLAAGRVTSGS